MALTIKRLRWFLAAAALLLVLVVAAYLGLGRYRALKAYLSVIRKAGATVSHDTNGFTYSQTEQGRTIFTLHARKATQLGEGRWALYGVNVILYSRDGLHNDVINGDQFTYNEQDGIVRAIGEVHMDLEAPDSIAAAGRSSLKPLAGSPPGTHSEPANVIHVRTSGVVYLRKLGVAATDQRVEFYYGGISGSAQGAEYNTSLSTLRLLSDVAASGTLRARPFVLHAASADIDRTANIATLPHTVASSDGRNASADLTLLDLRNDGSIAAAKATGHVLLVAATEHITAAQLDATFTRQTVPIAAQLSGGVQLSDTDALRPTTGTASTADMAFDSRGALTSVLATGSPQLDLTDKRNLPRGLQREMHANRILASFTSTDKGAQLRELHATGAAETHGESLAPQPAPADRSVNAKSAARHRTRRPAPEADPVKLSTLTADDLDLTFALDPSGNPEPQHLVATGNTLLRQHAPTGEVSTSSADALEATFAPADAQGKTQLALASARQTGNVIVRRTALQTAAPATSPGSRRGTGTPQLLVTTATASDASYNGLSDKLTLTGNAHLTQQNSTLTAITIVLDQRTQDADATGNLQATLAHAESFPDTAHNHPTPYTHILANSAHFAHQSQQAAFRGTDAEPARLWQGPSQVQAANLFFDDLRRTFTATPSTPGELVHAVFAATPATADKPAASKPDNDKPLTARSTFLRVAAPRLDYNDLQRIAVFSGPSGVTLQNDAGTLRAQRATAYLAPASTTTTAASSDPTPFGGSLDRVVLSGDVRIDQPGRHGTGEQLVYTAATGESLLTGTPTQPPHIVDAQHDSITGTSLLFADSGSTIVVSGQPQAARPVRVHTETYIQPAKAERH